jgi:hypothetical protein
MDILVTPLLQRKLALFVTKILGLGFTVIVNVCGVPGQEFPVGVTVIVAVTGVVPALVAVNAAIFPEPLAANPIEGSLFVQV